MTVDLTGSLTRRAVTADPQPPRSTPLRIIPMSDPCKSSPCLTPAKSHFHDLPLQVVPDQVVPDQVVPDQVVPDHVVPDQVWSAQSTLDHVVPDHVVPDHVVPDHVVPDHVVPDHVVPFQSPPDHVVPRAASEAHVAVSKGIPKMSCSPDRITPLFSRWLLPRDCSRLPAPVDPVQFCLEPPLSGSEALAASDRWRVPAP